MTDPFRLDLSLDEGNALPGASTSDGNHPAVQLGTGPGPLTNLSLPGTDPLLDAFLAPPSDGADSTIRHQSPAVRRDPLPVMSFKPPAQLLGRPVHAQADPSLTSALTLAEHRIVAALMDVPVSQWHACRGWERAGRLQVSYSVPNPQAATAAAAPRVVVALEIQPAPQASSGGDVLTRMVVGVPGMPPLALPVQERRAISDGSTTIEVLVPQGPVGGGADAATQQAALQAEPLGWVFSGDGDERSLLCALNDAQTHQLLAATWKVQRHAVLGAWVLTDLVVEPLDLGGGEQAATSTASAYSTMAPQSATGTTNWTLAPSLDCSANGTFRQTLTRSGIKAAELPQTTGHRSTQADGRQAARDILDACRQATPVRSVNGITSYTNVPLPRWPGLGAAHAAATYDIRLQHVGNQVTSLSVFAAPSAASTTTHSTTTDTDD